MENETEYKQATAKLQQLKSLQPDFDKEESELIREIEENIEQSIKALLARQDRLIAQVKSKMDNRRKKFQTKRVAEAIKACDNLLRTGTELYPFQRSAAKNSWKVAADMHVDASNDPIEVMLAPLEEVIERHGVVRSGDNDDQCTYYAGQLSLKTDHRIRLKGCFWIFQYAGNLVLYNYSGSPLWATGNGFSWCVEKTGTFRFTAAGALELVNGTKTYHSWTPKLLPGGSVTLRNSQPFMQLKDSQGNVQFSTEYIFHAGFSLSVGQYVRQGSLYLTLTSTANAVVYSGSIGGTVLWTTRVTGQTSTDNCLFVFQGDGNLVLYNSNSAPFASATFEPTATLRFNSTAPYLTIVSTSGTVLWRSI